MKPKFTKTNVIGLILAVLALFPALEPHVGLIGQMLVGGGGALLALVDVVLQRKKAKLEMPEEK